MIDKLWQIHKESIPEYEGKIWINQTGGLDSRVLGWLVSQKRQIDMGFYYYYKESRPNLKHVEQLVSLMNYKDFKFIELERSGYGGFDAAAAKTGYDPSDYTYIVNSFGDSVSGRFRTKKRERRFWLELEKETHLPETKFKSIEMPLFNQRLIGYFYSLPRSQRMFQRAYIKMIKKYIPFDIPRCFENGIEPIKMNWSYLPVATLRYYQYQLTSGKTFF